MFLELEYFQNSVRAYLGAAAVFFGFLFAFKIARTLILGRLRGWAARTETTLDDLVVELLGMIRAPEQYLFGFYLATRPLQLPSWFDKGLRAAAIAAVAYRVMRMLQRIAAFVVDRLLSEADSSARHSARTIGYFVNALIWVVAVLFVLSNLGFNVSSIVAGLGIGGIAVALAAQAVLGDLFAALAIWLDRPFVLGDFIVFDEFMGTVEEMGIKTTRIRALSGEQLVIPNSSISSAKIRNFRRLSERRVVLRYGASYATPRAKLARLPGLIGGIVAAEPKVRLERVHLDALADSSIDFEVVYFVLSDDYNLHMDIKQRIHLAVLEAFEKEGVEMPFTTQTIQLAKEPA